MRHGLEHSGMSNEDSPWDSLIPRLSIQYASVCEWSVNMFLTFKYYYSLLFLTGYKTLLLSEHYDKSDPSWSWCGWSGSHSSYPH